MLLAMKSGYAVAHAANAIQLSMLLLALTKQIYNRKVDEAPDVMLFVVW
jgi:hypothetical protein